MKIFVVGSGKLANAILSSGLSFLTCEIIKWESKYQNLNDKSIIVHAGSGRLSEECYKFCSRTKSVFIELATGLETEKLKPDFPLIICPNTSILVLKTLNMIKAYGRHFKNYKISITESHQSTKKTEAGTAIAFADSLNFPSYKIESIRDPDVQENQLKIPKEFLSSHAYHKIVIKDDNDEITLETKVLGHKSYAQGVEKIIEIVLKFNLENKTYFIWDLINNKD